MVQLKDYRDKSLDVICGLFIINMILGHILQWSNLTDSLLYQLTDLFFFFMPWFFYKSGYFFQKRRIYEVVTKYAKKFLSKYVLWSIIGSCFYVIILYQQNSLDFLSFLKSLFRYVIWYEAPQGICHCGFYLSYI